MGFRVTTKGANLSSLAAKLRALPRNLRKEVAKQLAEETINLVAEGFNTETDPYGHPWPPKKKPDGRKTLSGKTGRLKTGWHVVKVTERGFEIAPSVSYAAAHQSPKDGKRPQRMMVPDPAKGIPSAWEDVYDEIIAEVTEDALKDIG